MQQHSQKRPWRRSPVGIVTICLLGAAAFLLLTEHTSHFLSVLPYLLIAACPLMHLFMHHGHGHSGGFDHGSSDK